MTRGDKAAWSCIVLLLRILFWLGCSPVVYLPEGRKMLRVGGFHKCCPEALNHTIHCVLSSPLHQGFHDLDSIGSSLTVPNHSCCANPTKTCSLFHDNAALPMEGEGELPGGRATCGQPPEVCGCGKAGRRLWSDLSCWPQMSALGPGLCLPLLLNLRRLPWLDYPWPTLHLQQYVHC